jgi:tetratricopeptide (TPR) repeat protein
MRSRLAPLAALFGLFAASPARAQLAGSPSSGMSSEPEVNLAFAAQTSPRPAECTKEGGRSGALRPSWDRARRPAEAQYCDVLARGYTLLGRSPERALEAARRAEKLLGGRAASAVLEGRALLALGDPNGAWRAFERARKIARRSVEPPAVLHAVAVSALLLGKELEAEAAYRSLVPRASLLPDARQRQRVLVEAGLVLMARGSERLDEAIGYLAEARKRKAESGLGDAALGALALALDRQGRAQEARGVAAEAGGPFALIRMAEKLPAARPFTVAEADLHAMAAILAERKYPAVAKTEWQAYIESEDPRSPWLEHAKKKLESGGAPAKRTPR